MRYRGFFGLLLLCPVAAFSQIAANAGSPKTLTYDVVSIRPHSPGDGSSTWNTSPEGFKAANTSLKNIFSTAYDVRPDLISGLPGWADDARYDIDAKLLDRTPEEMKAFTPAQRRQMLQAVLLERFHAKSHIETKMLPAYDLALGKDKTRFERIAHADGKQSAPGVGSGGYSWSSNDKGESVIHATEIGTSGIAGSFPMSFIAR